MIVKPYDHRRADISQLERLREDPSLDPGRRNRIDRTIRRLQAGSSGEAETAYELDFHFGPSPRFLVFHGLRFEVNGRVAQIDHLLVDPTLEVYLIESKTRTNGLVINEHGEFSTTDGEGRRIAVPSPIEQVNRHRRVFSDALRAGVIRRPRLFGVLPARVPCRTVIAVAGGTVIERPDRRVRGVDRVVRADMVRSLVRRDIFCWRGSFLSGFDVAGTFAGQRMRSEFGEAILSAHRPSATDWRAVFGLTAANVPSEASTACEICGRTLSARVIDFCQSRLGGHMLCLEHQRGGTLRTTDGSRA